MSGPNGIAIRQTPELYLVMVGGRWLIGPGDTLAAKPADGVPMRVRLSPVFEFVGAFHQGPAGQIGVSRTALPVGTLASLKSITVAPDAVIALSELGHGEQRDLTRCYEQAQELAGQMRAQAAGILAPNAPPVPMPKR